MRAPGEGGSDAVRAQARDWAYQRLAFASAAIWAGLTAILYATFVPYVVHPQLYIAIASVVPLAPAALPWLFYRWLTNVRTRKLLAQQSK